MQTGTVTTVREDKNFGFIALSGHPDCFFHRNDLADDLEFDGRLIERRVQFDVVDNGRGPKAINIQPVKEVYNF